MNSVSLLFAAAQLITAQPDKELPCRFADHSLSTMSILSRQIGQSRLLADHGDGARQLMALTACAPLYGASNRPCRSSSDRQPKRPAPADGGDLRGMLLGRAGGSSTCARAASGVRLFRRLEANADYGPSAVERRARGVRDDHLRSAQISYGQILQIAFRGSRSDRAQSPGTDVGTNIVPRSSMRSRAAAHRRKLYRAAQQATPSARSSLKCAVTASIAEAIIRITWSTIVGAVHRLQRSAKVDEFKREFPRLQRQPVLAASR